MSMVDPTALWGGAALMGLLAACWSKVKLLLARVWSLAFVTVTVHGDAARALQAMCWTTLRRSPFGRRSYGSDPDHVRPRGGYQVVGYERAGTDRFFFWRGGRRLPLGTPPQRRGTAAGEAAPPPNTGQIQLTF